MIPKLIFAFINLVCIALAAFFVVDGVYGHLTANFGQAPAAVAQQAFRAGEGEIRIQPVSAYKAVIDRNLFGIRADAAPAPAAVDVASLEETKLNLKLWGTVSGSADGDYAVIEDIKAREQNLYRIGDAVQTATVKEIFREKVVLTVGERDEVLQMEELESGKGITRPGGLPQRTPTSATEASGGGARTQRISLRRSYIEQSMTDMSSLLTQVQIQPHMENGMPSGLSLSSIKPNSIFRRMGLRNGDVITGVDGSDISTVDDALRLVENLKSASTVSVQLKRRGLEKNIEYRIR